MGFRLVGTVSGRAVDLPLVRQQMTLGSGAGCDLSVSHVSVSREHARLIVHGDEVEVVDLGSRNGTFLGSTRVLSTRVHAGDELSFGSVQLRLEETPDGDLRPGMPLRPQAREARTDGRLSSTLGLKPADSFATDRLPGLLELLGSGASATAMAQAVGAALLATLPVTRIEIRSEHGDAKGVLYRASNVGEGKNSGDPLEARRSGFTVQLQLPHLQMNDTYAPLAEASVLLIGLAAGANVTPTAPAGPEASLPLPAPESTDEEVRRIYTEAAVVAKGEVGVFIYGESGTGKEVLGRYIHAASPRADKPFAALNCASLPRDLLEAELFGIERGVATGVDERPGKFELADGGTLFLDEIGDMDRTTQASILRVLQEGEVYRVGAARPRSADVRVVAATNRNMNELLEAGRFREDLYYRIATWEVTVPPLRKRRGDIPNLAAHFLDRAALQRNVRVAGISETALEVLVAYSWPGNIRQLLKEMTRAALFVADGGLLTSAHLVPKIVEEVRGTPRLTLEERVNEFLRTELTDELRIAQGDVGRVAEVFGVSRSTLYRRLKDLGVDPTRLGNPARTPG